MEDTVPGRKGDSAPDPEEEFALVSLYDGSSPPEG